MENGLRRCLQMAQRGREKLTWPLLVGQRLEHLGRAVAPFRLAHYVFPDNLNPGRTEVRRGEG